MDSSCNRIRCYRFSIRPSFDVLIDGTAKMTVEIAEKIIEEIEKKVKN